MTETYQQEGKGQGEENVSQPTERTRAGGLTPNENLQSSWKLGGSRVDLASTVRGAITLSSATIPTRKEHFYELFWKHKHATVTLCSVFWSFGLCVAFLGPTLLDLGCKTSTVFSTMSWVFFSQSLFILLGSACGGILVQRFTPNVLLLVGTIMMTVTMSFIPLCRILGALAFVLAVMGYFMGTIDTVANVSMIRIYGKDVSPFLQALHFFYGVGAFVSPMIAQPFLLNEDCSPFIDNSTEAVDHFEDNEILPATTLKEAQIKTHIDYAFWIMALLMVPVILLTMSLVGRELYGRYFGGGDFNQNKQGQYESTDTETSATEERGDNIPPATTFQTILISLLCAALMFLYDGLQAAYGGYVYSYAVKGPVRLKRSDAAYLNALFWGMFATGRLISIALATKLAPSFMLFCNISGCIFGMILMLLMSHNQTVLIVGTCILGIFMSSVFPTALSLTEQYIHVTPTITSFLVFGAALGEMSMPVILGHEFERTGPITFLVTGTVLCFLSLIVYLALWVAGHSVIRYAASPGILGFLNSCIPNKKTAEGEDTGLMTQHVRYYSRMQSDMSESSICEQYADTTLNEEAKPDSK